MNREISPTLSQKPCANCRRRKIACDRHLPTCNTCSRRKKQCEGYSNTLSWPGTHDRRRALKADIPAGHIAEPLFFLNTSSRDVAVYYGSLVTRLGLYSPIHVPKPLPGPNLGTSLTHNEYTFALQVVTSHGDLRRDICNLLYRMAISDDAAPSVAVRSSMNAISYYSLNQISISKHHQFKAISALREAITQITDYKSRAQAIAASMLLSMYEILTQPNDLHDMMQRWTVYFNGCIMIFQSPNFSINNYDGEAETLLDWVSYYSVFFKLCIIHWFQRQSSSQGVLDHETTLSWATLQPRSSLIKSSFGCSLGLLRLLHRSIELACARNESESLSHSHEILAAANDLEHEIDTCQQLVCDTVDKTGDDGPGTWKHYSAVARLFQLSALIYLDRVVRGLPASSLLSQQSAKEAFTIMQDLKMCERPFPLLMLALQAQGDDERRIILTVLENATRQRELGDLTMTESVVRTIWAQQDLQDDPDVDGLVILNLAFRAYEKPPCLSFHSQTSTTNRV
ncbi:unnamed protein product [Clonostachys byssicola]|uniref:Zn(2)-C6 fungal-type domain-containing protein n=1 Tax=Clonostachys byssicola TaxID=160290 RepID=A0A9N9UZM3_9HYPO|nr:unnamed protein product [Clonostachys byssicola]